jgi:hypothetical protein
MTGLGARIKHERAAHCAAQIVPNSRLTRSSARDAPGIFQCRQRPERVTAIDPVVQKQPAIEFQHGDPESISGSQ